MSLIANCLTKLVKSGQVSQKAANDALSLYEGAQGRLYPTMPPASADAAAALEVAKIMAEGARQKKLAYAKQAIALRRIEDRMASHSKGATAGAMSVLTRDIHDEQGFNVDSQTEVVLGWLLGKADAFAGKFRNRVIGAGQDYVGIRNAIMEMRGKDTGDAAAKEAATAMTGAIEAGYKRWRAAGGQGTILDDWMTPQFWDTSRVRRFGREQFIADMRREIESGNMTVINKGEFREANRLEIEGILQQAYTDISVGRRASDGAVVGGAGRDYTRVFRFKKGEAGSEAYMRMMDKYGPGDKGYYGMMIGYLNSMAREVALVELLGPDHAASARHMIDQARAWEAEAFNGRAVKMPFIGKEAVLPSADQLKLRRPVENPAAIERTYRYQTGQVNAVESEMMAAAFGGLRAINTAAKLGTAAVTALFGDTATAAFTRAFNGMPIFGMVRTVANDVTMSGDAKRQLLARMNLMAHSVMESGVGAKRFEDEIAGRDLPSRIATAVIRAQGLSYLTDLQKRTFTLEAMGWLASGVDRSFDDLDDGMRAFLKRYSFTADDWEKLRAAPLFDVNGATFFDVNAIEERELADRLVGAVIDERHFAVVEPDSRIRQLTTMGQKRGTIPGEMVRSSFMFKSFSMSILLTHFKRYAGMDNRMKGAAWLTGFVGLMTLAGGMALLTRDPIMGRDVRDPNDPLFAAEAFFYGGGMGIYGDLLSQAKARGGVEAGALIGGPAFEMGLDLFNGPVKTVRNFVEGKDQKFGERLAQFTSRYMPGSSLWYTRLALDRMLFDQMQSFIDNDYGASFAREEERLRKRSGQDFWWRPGDMAPDRAPAMSESPRPIF